MFPNKSQLFLDPHITYPIHDLQLSFSEYLAQSKQIISSHRVDLQQFKELIIEANSPFEFRPEKPAQYGALLIHGLFDSPFMMRDIGKKLCDQGLMVRSILLPGHGTVPGALLNTKYNDWLEAARYGISSFSHKVEKLFLVGFSTGGSIACHPVTQSLSTPIAGIILLAPAFKIRSPLAVFSSWPMLKWLSKQNEDDYVRYQSATINAIHQAKLLMNIVKDKSISCPQYIAIPLNDKTIDSQATLDYFSKQSNSKNRMILYTNKKIRLNDKRITIRDSYFPEQRILDMSHIGIPISPLNSHYGIEGDYLLASHTKNFRPDVIYDEVNHMEVQLYKWLYKYKLTKQMHNRLTFNPDFDYLIQSMIEFIQAQR